MKKIKIGWLLFYIVLGLACSSGSTNVKEKPKDKEKSKDVTADQKTDAAPSANTQCDPELWKRVYNPSRLEVIEQCKVVTGVIDELDQNEDGDTHMLLKLDPGQEGLLAKKNLKKKDGDLVVEVVCANAITDKKAVEACKGYSNTVKLPVVGDHVTVIGSYVNDSHNGWNEIHPVTSIQKG